MKGLKINYDKTFATKYSRDYYRGASFHYSGKWTAGVHYVADSYNTDFCASHQVLLACKLSHTSDEYNDPAKHFIYDEDQNIIGIKSKYWDIVIAGINIIGETKEWVDERIDGVIEAYKADIEFSARGLRTEFTHDIDDAVNGVTRNYRSEISQTAEEIRSTVEAVETSLDGKMEENYSELKQRADSISATVAQNKSDIEGNLEQKYSELKMTADEIATTVSDVKTDLEGNISNKFSEISQRADQISARVEEVNSNLNGDLEEKYSELKMTADEITSTVAANKTELDNTIQENYSQLSQRADSITATVAQNRSDLEGNIESKFSEVSQKADEIAARVEEVSQQSTGELEKKYSELIMTTDAISATVAANKTATDGSISDLSSNITQTATEIRSEVNRKITDVDGKVEEAKSSISQTAEQIMATVEANKTELDGTISANYSELKQTAEEISATVTANKTATDGRIEKNYSELKQTAEEISSTVASNKKAAEDALDAVNEELSSRITQTSEAITSEVEARTTREGEIVSDYTSKIQQTAEAITSEVSARETAIEGVQTDYNSKISQTADNITSSVKETTDALGERLTTAETSITQNTNSIELAAERLNTFETSVGNQFASNAELLRSLQNQVDGAIETYYENYEPTLQNAPASNWTTDEIKKNHVGDLFYNKNTGYSYRFFNENGTYQWSRITDSDITTALANAAKAQSTADGKMTIFYTQPSTYRKGDLWIAENNENECIIKKSNYDRDNNYVSTDWVEVSDLANATKVRAAFSVLADMIQSEVGEYTSDNNLVPGSLYSKILQSRDHISAKIGKAVSDSEDATAQSLLDTGIDIEDKKITLTADHVYLKNNAGATSALSVVTVNNTPVISAENLQLTGVLSTSAWNAGKTALEQYADSKASTAQQNAINTASTDATNKANTAEANAKGYADTKKTEAIAAAKVYSDSTDYLNSIKGTITAGFATTESVNNAIAGLDYLKAALTEESTIIQGGLVLSSLIQLGSGAKTSSWQVWSGLNGQIASGHTVADTIAFWAGGDMTESGSRAAKAVIRMDGTGYLAGGNISWDTSGNASFNGDVVAKSFTIGNANWNDVKSGILNTAASDATTKANNAKNTAINTAASDATAKANAAESNARSDITTKITSLKNNEIKAAKDAADAAQTRADNAYTLANGKADLSDIADSNTLMAQKLGFADYNAFKNAAAAKNTIINGGYINTQLIEANAITADMINATNLHVNSANIDGTITATNLNAATGTFTGTLSAATGSFSGSITANSGQIGGWTIQSNYLDLYDPDNDFHRLRMGYWYDGPNDKRYVFAAGADWVDSDEFNFAIDDEGHMYASGASISGRIESSEGQIGGFTIGTSKLYNDLSTLNGTSNGIYLGTDGIALGGGKFKVTKAGTLTATNANITGTITASAGQIGQLQIKSDGMGLLYGSQNDDHTTTEFEINPNYLIFSRTDDHNWPIAIFKVDVTGGSRAVCDIDISYGEDIPPLYINLGQQLSPGIIVNTNASRDNCKIYPDSITFSNGNTIDVNGVTCNGITCKGMFSGLRPKTRYITSSTSSSDRYLDSSDYNIVVNNSSSLTLYLPSSQKAGQTYYIMHATATALSIHSNSTNIFSMSANVTKQDISFTARGTLLVVWNASQSRWICDILSSY